MRTPLVLCAGLLAAALPARPQVSGVAQAGVSAQVLAPAAANETLALGGDLDSGTTLEGDLVVDPGGAEAARAGPATPGAGAGPGRRTGTRSTLHPARVRVQGRQGVVLGVVLPGAGECFLEAPGARIPVDGFRVSVANGTPTGTPTGLVLDSRGYQELKVGATFHLSVGQPKLHYTGHFPVTVAYN